MQDHEQALEWIAELVPSPTLQALLIILLAMVLARIADWIMTRIIARLLARTKMLFDDQILQIFHRPIFVSIVLLGLIVASERLVLPEMVNAFTAAGLKTVAIWIWAVACARFLKLLVTALSGDESRFELIQDRTLPLFKNLLGVLVFVLAIYFMLLAWQIDVTAWMASAGILGLAISFAAKDTLANLFAGVFIMADAPYKLGDYIVLDSGGRGEVTHIGIRSTRLLTRDDVEITVPNSIMGSAKITNESGGPHEKFRIRIQVGVAYGSDLDLVHRVLDQVARAHPQVCDDPSPRVRFRAFGASSLDHELLCWVEQPMLRGRVSHFLNTEVYKRFIAEGIEIPFPQRDLHIKSQAPAEPAEQ